MADSTQTEGRKREIALLLIYLRDGRVIPARGVACTCEDDDPWRARIAYLGLRAGEMGELPASAVKRVSFVYAHADSPEIAGSLPEIRQAVADQAIAQEAARTGGGVVLGRFSGN